MIEIATMKRIANAIVTLLFIGGVLIVPIVHRMHCDDNHDTHEAAKCSICQLAHTTAITTASVIVPITGIINLGDAILPHTFIHFLPLHDPTQARAPPVS